MSELDDRWFVDRIDIPDTLVCGCRSDQPTHTCASVMRGERVYTCACGVKVVRASVLTGARSRNTYWEVDRDCEHEHEVTT